MMQNSVAQAPGAVAGNQATKPAQDYAELKALVRQAGLLSKQPQYYAVKFIYTLGLLAAGIAILVLFDNLWVRVIDALYLTLVFAQIAFLGHDMGHKQVFSSTRANTLFALLIGNLVIGMSVGWWVEKHNAHHAKPNHIDSDPDLDIPLMAFSREEALQKKGIARSIVKYQAFLFFPFLMLAAIDFQIQSVLYQFRPKIQYRVGETGLLAAHILLYVGGLVWLMGPFGALAFMALHQATLGIVLGSAFAPNHKGMLIIDDSDDSSKLDFLRMQVLTARNVRPSPLVDFWYGGLNYQIEHHLFPSMPRNKLPQARLIIKQFCRSRGIDYYETGVVRSNIEIVQFLHGIGRVLSQPSGSY
jgi:fatty acid desaturase